MKENKLYEYAIKSGFFTTIIHGNIDTLSKKQQREKTQKRSFTRIPYFFVFACF